MSEFMQSIFFSRNRKTRWEKRLQQLAQMRAAKERKRLANPVEREPEFERWFPLELGVRDKHSGEVAWVDLRSVRDAAKRISVMLNNYTP